MKQIGAARSLDRRAPCGAYSPVARVPQDAYPFPDGGIFGHDFAQTVDAAVGRSIVDEDELPRRRRAARTTNGRSRRYSAPLRRRERAPRGRAHVAGLLPYPCKCSELSVALQQSKSNAVRLSQKITGFLHNGVSTLWYFAVMAVKGELPQLRGTRRTYGGRPLRRTGTAGQRPVAGGRTAAPAGRSARGLRFFWR